MTGRSGALLEREAHATYTARDHACSNCGRPASREDEADFSRGPAVYSCPTCGQREEVHFRTIPVRVVTEVHVVEEPYIILGDT